MELKCMIQKYDWGKYGMDSIIASLMKSSNINFVPKEDIPYAELWMGTHINGPSYLHNTNISLQTYIEENSETLGHETKEKFGCGLPFLFKVLSVKKALSIQVHPNKEKAKELHESYPSIYKDANHKPELTIALTPFEALYGFRPMKEIKNYIIKISELRVVLGESKVTELMTVDDTGFSAALKACFHHLMTCDTELVESQLEKLLTRLSTLDESSRQWYNAAILERLYMDYPGDVGCFTIYLFNWIILQPGEAIYIEPNEPHAYLSGDCIECMASSDNVIRAGLTPKLKDVSTLIKMLTYKCESIKKFQPCRQDECTEVFRPPVPDFAVVRIIIPSGQILYNLIPRSTASILIVINGEVQIDSSKILKRGSVIFISANEKLEMKILCCFPILMFQAFINI